MAWDTIFSGIQHVTLGKISDSDMRQCIFLKSTCDIGDPPSRAPSDMGMAVGDGVTRTLSIFEPSC